MALIGLSVAVSACTSGGPTASPTTGSPAGASTSGASTTGGSGTPSTTATITIKNFSFSPSRLTVSPGERITVTNHDSVTHTLTATDMTFNTGDIASGSTVTFTAPRTPGSYGYECLIHQFMTGTLVVTG